MFNDKYGLTQAVLEGRKTMTRRIVPKHILNEVEKYQDEYYNGALETISEKDAILAICTYEHRFKLPYKVGEVVAIAQNYKDANVTLLDYLKATDNKGKGYDKGCSNKEFVKADLMPHHIRITNVRVERLQDISDDDCYREGVETEIGKYFNYAKVNNLGFHTDPRVVFSALINKLSGKGTWAKNPYVFVYEFECINPKEIDQIRKTIVL